MLKKSSLLFEDEYKKCEQMVLTKNRFFTSISIVLFLAGLQELTYTVNSISNY